LGGVLDFPVLMGLNPTKAQTQLLMILIGNNPCRTQQMSFFGASAVLVFSFQFHGLVDSWAIPPLWVTDCLILK